MIEDNTKQTYPFQNANCSIEKRVNDLVSRMTLEEQVSQMLHNSPAIERLDIPAYNWWNECLHGVARAGIATVFPQAIGLAATWNTSLIGNIATVISDEARAKHHDAARRGIRDIYFGLTFWTPNINIFRDPRWGRGQETYGEDPVLTARMGVTFVKGLQGDHPKYLKVVATPKHFAVHSGPEKDRHTFDARVCEKDLRETYLPAFQACVQEAKAVSVMGAYNRTNGEPCCSSKRLLDQILRTEWGFEGYVVSDCGAIEDIYQTHRMVRISEKAVARAVEAGCDLCCGKAYESLVNAVKTGLLSADKIRQSVQRLFTARFRLGLFDPPQQVPYAQIPMAVTDCPAHRRLALQAARESMVLLKNENKFLPLSPNIKSIAVIGPNADDEVVLLGNYNGTPSKAVSVLEGIKNKLSPSGKVLFAKGCRIRQPIENGLADAIGAARQAEVVIFVGGLSQTLEGEEGEIINVEEGEKALGDREDLNLPEAQEQILEAIHKTGKPLVVVLINGSALSIAWADEHAQAILEAWYPGQDGGTAVADVLFGDYNPSGRLPVTFYKSVNDLPPFTDYNMSGRTYRYFTGEPLYPFGYGLSFTDFEYSNLQISPRTAGPSENIHVGVDVENTGLFDGDEVVQLYITDVEAGCTVPLRQLQAFQRIHLKKKQKATVNFTLNPHQFSFIDEYGNRVLEPGEFIITVGGGQPNTPKTSNVLTGSYRMLPPAANLP
jgi:beta-glucosidase